MKKLPSLILFTGLLILSACSNSVPSANSSTSSNTNNPTSNNSSTSPTVAAGNVDPCSILNKSDVENVLGGSFSTSSDNVSVGDNGNFKTSNCQFTSTATNTQSANQITLYVFTSDSSQSMQSQFQSNLSQDNQGMEGAGRTPETVNGIGDGAFWVAPLGAVPTGSFTVYKGTTMLNIVINGFQADSTAQLGKAKTFANMVLEKF